jgi:hypothetical protein
LLPAIVVTGVRLFENGVGVGEGDELGEVLGVGDGDGVGEGEVEGVGDGEGRVKIATERAPLFET